MEVFWFFFTKKNRKRFFLKKEAKTSVHSILVLTLAVPACPRAKVAPPQGAAISTVATGRTVHARS
jgi:hypothetical protein